MVKRIVVGLVIFMIALTGIYLIVTPSPVSPVAYVPPEKPELSGVLAPNDLLTAADILGAGLVDGPEDVDVDSEGRVYGGTSDGKILRVLPDGNVELFADTHGRPLGLHFDAEGNLIVCDSHKGLLSVDKNGQIRCLCDSAEGIQFRFTDDLDIASNGVIYFTDASDKFSQADYLLDLLEARPHGRLLSYDPKTGQTRVLLRYLYFANGVALSEHEDFVLVNETYRYRITRYWLKGPMAGKSDVFIDNLPGFPDGVSANRRGTFWVALFTVRNDLVDRFHPWVLLKSLMARTPRAVWPKPEPYGLVLALDEDGNIIRSLHDPNGRHLKEITSVEEHEGYLYLGSLHNDRIGRFALSAD